MVCPFGCVCHAVRAPGVKWTLLAVRRDPCDGAATVSTYTAPVNHSFGPAPVWMLFLVISILSSRWVRSAANTERLGRHLGLAAWGYRLGGGRPRARARASGEGAWWGKG